MTFREDPLKTTSHRLGSQAAGLPGAAALSSGPAASDRNPEAPDGRPRVLVVDDEIRVVESIRDALRKMPFRVLIATSGAEALSILEASPIDVIVSDERMPGMTGAELLTKVRSVYPDTIRIILTGHATIESTIKAINDGEVYRFLSKPCQIADLAQAIADGIRLRRLVRSSRKLLEHSEDQGRMLQRLEHEHPGISALVRDSDGVVLVPHEEQSVEELIQEIQGHLEGEGKE